MENAYELYFHRLFSINPYRSLRMKLCEMSFCKDWPHTDRGEPYPIVRESGAALGENVEGGRIAFSADAPGERARLIGRFFPYASSEVRVDALDGEGARVGLEFAARAGRRGSPCASEVARERLETAARGGSPYTAESVREGLEPAARRGSPCAPENVREGLESAARSGSPCTPEGVREGLESAARSGSPCAPAGVREGLESAAWSGSLCAPEGVRERLESAARSGSPCTPEDVREGLESAARRGSTCVPEGVREGLESAAWGGSPCAPEDVRESLESGARGGSPCAPEDVRESLESGARRGSTCMPEGVREGLESAARGGSPYTSEGMREGLEFAARSGSPYTAEDAPGLCVFLERAGAEVCVCHEEFVGGRSLGVVRHGTRAFAPGDVLFVSAHGAFFDVSLGREFVCTIQAEGFSDICRRSAFMNAGVSLYVGLPAGGRAAVSRAESFLDGGLSHADIKPVRYEDGTPILENGRLFLTLSSRLQAGAYQFVVSWNPSTCELRPEGAIFFDYGDGRWCADMAISLLYHREKREWLFWATAFSHGHILCHGTSAGDPRFGITVLDATLMEAQKLGSAANDSLSVQAGGRGASVAELDDDTLWLAKTGDEDPDFTYDRERGKWYMTICRNVDGAGYRYFLFESDEPFSGYRHVCHTGSGENTGGLMVCIRGRRALVCGSDFKARAEYRVYPLGDFSHFQRLTCDFDDGGFRGWGSLMPVPCGNRTKYVWMTFDRHNGSDYNWSYGNLYAYEAEEMDSQ